MSWASWVDLQSAGLCPLCGSRPCKAAFPYETSWKGVTYHHLRCRSCHTTYYDPLPAPEVIESVYQWDTYHQPNLVPFDGGDGLRLLGVLTENFVPEETDLIDFGCGAGSLLMQCAKAGYRCEGVEVSSQIAARTHERTGIPVGTLDEIETAGRTFDVIVMRDLMTHLPDPSQVIGRLLKLLKPGGSLCIDGPLEGSRNIATMTAGAAKAARRATGIDSVGETPPTMLFRVNAKGQRKFICETMGLKVIHFEVYETGWPYHARNRKITSPKIAIKEAFGLASIATAKVAARLGLEIGNRFIGLFQIQ